MNVTTNCVSLSSITLLCLTRFGWLSLSTNLLYSVQGMLQSFSKSTLLTTFTASRLPELTFRLSFTVPNDPLSMWFSKM